MGRYTKQDVIDLVRENDVEFIRLQFSDLFGTMKNVAITARQLEKALDNKCTFDGSSVDGFVRIEESDMYLYPDLDSFAIFPWNAGGNRVARLICDVYGQDGLPFAGDPRNVLKRVMVECQKMGYKFNVGPECEFFLFHTDDNGVPTTLTHEKAGYLDISPLDLGENARRDMVLNLEDMGYEIESSHHETAPAQHEIDFKFSGANEMADCVMTFKMAVRTIAKRHGLHATFMPKPRAEVNGSGMHIHFALYKDGKNIFADPDDVNGLSEDAYHFIGGLLAHSEEMAAITNPLVNSYKRLVPGYDAPTELTWTKNNQNSLIRISNLRSDSLAIELRSPDASANPYLVFAVCIAAGLDGIQQKLYPTKASDRSFSESDQKAMNIGNLPLNLDDALTHFENSTWIQSVLGKKFCEEYAAAKKEEWLNYMRQVSEWEISQYLYKI